jgi:hypothetical protein
MATPHPPRPVRLQIELLEGRELPATTAGLAEILKATPLPPGSGSVLALTGFDGPTGALPAGWRQWSSGGNPLFRVDSSHPLAGPSGLTAAGTSRDTARSWFGQSLPADVQVSAAVYLNSLSPVQVFARGKNLDTAAPSYYAVSITRGVRVQLLRVQGGKTTVLATPKSDRYLSNQWAQVTLSVSGHTLKAQVFRTDTAEYLAPDGSWQFKPAWALTATDTALPRAGQAGLARPAAYAGPVSFDNFAVTAAPASSGQPTPGPAPAAVSAPRTAPAPTSRLPAVPRHYSHIRLAELAFNGTPLGSFERGLLRKSIDLVLPSTSYLGTIDKVAPNTPQLIYSNVSNIYQGLLTDWLAYADRHGMSRESAFYHAAKALPFRGASPSSRPVDWFWGAAAGTDGAWTDLTSAAHSSTGTFSFGDEGESVAFGSPEKFREVNVQLQAGASAGWSAVLEYPTAVDAAGRPTAWKELRPLADGTHGLTRSGRVTFDPPAGWLPASVSGPDRLYYVRFRTTVAGNAPVARTVLGRDYVNAHGNPSGTIPAFDSAADKNHDGYLTDAEYAKRRKGYDARFLYESRVFYPTYGAMRFATNVTNANFQRWAADYQLRFLKSFPRADGLFLDNSIAKLDLPQASVKESLGGYTAGYAATVAAVTKAIAPRWVLGNTAGAGVAADPLLQVGASWFEENALRPLNSNWVQFEDEAGLIQRRLMADPSGYAVLDSFLGQYGSPLDTRAQLATLAYYYLVGDPVRTFLLFNGGHEPATGWSRHFIPAATYDVGRPEGTWFYFGGGRDPTDDRLGYHVYARRYDHALVLYKPLSYGGGRSGDAGNETATWQSLGGTYRPLKADGTLGAPVTRVRLRNGEGAVLVKV